MNSGRLDLFLEEIREEHKGRLPKDLHVTRKAGALVAISNGKVIKIKKPQVLHCPLFSALFSRDDLNAETIQYKFEKQISQWGMFTGGRHLCDEKIIVPFGASEMMMYALKRKNIDSSVVVCEGAGTVISSNPSLIQGIGAYMNGLFYTTPIPAVINNIYDNGGTVLSPDNAEIDQLKGVKRAVDSGCRRIAVTVRGDQQWAIKKIRELEKEINAKKGMGVNKDTRPDNVKIKPGADDKITGVRIIILAVCNTGIRLSQANTVRDCADLAWACASRKIWNAVGPVSILQIGMKIPVFVMTENGLDFISSYSSDDELKESLKDIGKKHYITSVRSEPGSIKLNMGKFSVFLYETESLPISTKDQPAPLI